MPRIRRLLERAQIPATFFYPAVSALLYPDEVRGVVADGHEIGNHTWLHELNTGLAHADERRLSFRAAEVLAEVSGRAPVGMRTASWDFSPNTLAIIREMGLLYDSSLMADDDPYELTRRRRTHRDRRAAAGNGSATTTCISACTAARRCGRTHAPPSAVEEIFAAEFDGTWEEGGLFLLTMPHPHVIGHRSRLPLLARLIAHIKARGNSWFATHAQVAQWCRDHA